MTLHERAEKLHISACPIPKKHGWAKPLAASQCFRCIEQALREAKEEIKKQSSLQLRLLIRATDLDGEWNKALMVADEAIRAIKIE